MVIWGGTFIAIKICLQQLVPIEIIGLRFIVGLPLLALLVYFSRVSWKIERSDLPRLLFASVMLVLQFLAQAYALTMTTATNTAWLVAVSPLAIALLGALVLKEHLGRETIIGISIATIGVILLVSKGRLADLGWLRSIGDWMVLFSAINWAIYAISIRDITRRRGPLLVTLLVYTPLTFVGIAGLIVSDTITRLPDLSTAVWWWLLFLAVPGTIAHWLWNVGLSQIGAVKAGIYIYLESVTTTIIAVPLLHETFGWGTAIGAALIIVGVQWGQRRGR